MRVMLPSGPYRMSTVVKEGGYIGSQTSLQVVPGPQEYQATTALTALSS